MRSCGKRCKLCEAVRSGASVANHLRHLCYSHSTCHLRTRKALSVGCNLQELRCEAVRDGAKRCEAVRSRSKRCKLCEAVQSGASVANHLSHLCYSRSTCHLRTRKALSVGCNLQELRCEAVRDGAKRCEAVRSGANLCKLCEAVRSGASVANHLRHLWYSRSLRHLRYLRTRKALSNLQQFRCEARKAVQSGAKRCRNAQLKAPHESCLRMVNQRRR